MNPRLAILHPYPFEKLRQLLPKEGAPASHFPAIDLSIGEPKHEPPACVVDAMIQALPGGLASYPPTKGNAQLRQVIAQWLSIRYQIPALDPETQILPILGSREALFAITQTIINPTSNERVLCPNPFYQIYEGAALLAGAHPYFVNVQPHRNFGLDWSQVHDKIWRRTRMVFVCSPGNPTGHVLSMAEWEYLFKRSDEYNFIIVSDECYSEIYPEGSPPPIGALQAAHALGRHNYKNLMVFSSLSKRSNVPGLRSGFCAGDAKLTASFLRYRTYHGSAMNPVVAAASIAAWSDETHVVANRRAYTEKFAAVVPILQRVLAVTQPPAGFYLWVPTTPWSDTDFSQALYQHKGVTVLPGSFLARQAHGINPGCNYVRMALVAPLAQCVDAAERMVDFVHENF